MGKIEIGISNVCYEDDLNIDEARKLIKDFRIDTNVYGLPVTFYSQPIRLKKGPNRYCYSMRFLCDIPLHFDRVHNTIDEIDGIWNLFDDLYMDEIKAIAGSILLSIVLCKPDFNMRSAMIYTKFDGKLVRKEFFIDTFSYSEAAHKHADLLSTNLTLQETWNWIHDHTSLFGKKQKSPMAIAALSYILNRENHEALLYSIIGLESIYCPEDSGISFILQSRITHIFPSITRRQIKHLYDLRSNFVHGGKLIGVKYSDDETYEDDCEYKEYAFLSYALLVETLRLLIHNNAETINFSSTISYEYQ